MNNKTITVRPSDGCVVLENSTGIRIGNAYREVDGFYVFNPDLTNGGAWTQEILHEVHEILSDLNREWDKQIERDFTQPAQKLCFDGSGMTAEQGRDALQKNLDEINRQLKPCSPLGFTSNEVQFAESFRNMQDRVHKTAVEKGWWRERRELLRIMQGYEGLGSYAKSILTGCSIALMHSELSEAMEGVRAGNPKDDKIPLFRSIESEYADTIIRIMDDAQENNLNVAGALVAKARFNDGREHKHGGKTC